MAFRFSRAVVVAFLVGSFAGQAGTVWLLAQVNDRAPDLLAWYLPVAGRGAGALAVVGGMLLDGYLVGRVVGRWLARRRLRGAS